MPAPSTYIDITSTPFSRLVTQAAFNAGTYGGTARATWFRYVATGAMCLGVHTDRGGTFNPSLGIYQSDGTTVVRTGSASTSFYGQLPTAGTYYVKVSGSDASDFDFTFLADAKPLNAFTIPRGSLIINDDANGPPAAVMTPAGELLGFLSAIPGGEIGAVLPGGASIWQDLYGKHSAVGSFALFDSTPAYVASANPAAYGGFHLPAAASATNFFTVHKPTGRVYRITPAGVVTGPIATLPATTLIFAFGVSRDGTIAYWAAKGSAALHRHNLTTDVALSDIYTTPDGTAIGVTANNKPGEILCLPDGTLVTWYGDVFLPSTLVHLSATGTLLASYPFASTPFPFVDHVSYTDINGSSAVNLWRLKDPGLDVGRFCRFNLATGLESPTFDRALFQFQSNLITDDPTVLSPSESCSFITFILPEPIGTLIVTKQAPADTTRDFTIQAGGGLSPSSFTLRDGQTRTFLEVPAGTYSLAEILPDGWTLQSATVSNGSSLDNITVADGEVVTVTLANAKEICECCVATKIHIINQALLKIGVSQLIVSLDEASREAFTGNELYDPVLRETLRHFPWPFATKYAAATDLLVGYMNLIAGTETAPAVRRADGSVEWQYMYRYPVDCVKARRIVPTSGRSFNRKQLEFRVGRQWDGLKVPIVYSNEPDAMLEYTAIVECAEDFFDSLFEDALSWRLASKLAPSLARNGLTSADCWRMYLHTVDTAEAVASQEQQQHRDGEAEWIEGRD